MRVADGDDESGEHPVEEDRDRAVEEEEEAREHGEEIDVAEEQPFGGEEAPRLEKEAALAREIEADLSHHGNDEELRGQEVLVGHEARVPGLHRRKKRDVEEGDQRLAGDAQDEQGKQCPEEQAKASQTSFCSADTTRSG